MEREPVSAERCREVLAVRSALCRVRGEFLRIRLTLRGG